MWGGWSVLAITAVVVIALQKTHAANTSNNSAETEAFYSAEWQPGIGSDHCVDETIPVSNSDVNNLRSWGSFVHALAARPNVVSFASSIASLASRTRKIDATGPNTS